MPVFLFLKSEPGQLPKTRCRWYGAYACPDSPPPERQQSNQWKTIHRTGLYNLSGTLSIHLPPRTTTCSRLARSSSRATRATCGTHARRFFKPSVPCKGEAERIQSTCIQHCFHICGMNYYGDCVCEEWQSSGGRTILGYNPSGCLHN